MRKEEVIFYLVLWIALVVSFLCVVGSFLKGNVLGSTGWGTVFFLALTTFIINVKE